MPRIPRAILKSRELRAAMEKESVLPDQSGVDVKNEIRFSVCKEMEDAMEECGIAPLVKDASTSTTMDKRQAEEMEDAMDDSETSLSVNVASSSPIPKRRSVLSSGTSLLSDTPISLFQASNHSPEAPKKSALYLCRVQQPPLEKLCEDWSLEDYGMVGTWGYLFKYEPGELYLYQLDGDEKLTCISVTFSLTYNDWAVLRLAIPYNTEIKEESATPDRSVLIDVPSDLEIVNKKLLFSATWQTKSTVNGSWSLRASRRRSDNDLSPDLFVLEAFNAESGIFRTMLALPFNAWSQKMNEIGDRISNLFRSSRCWLDIMTVKKTLSFGDTPSK